jgi:hypothetical protein
MPSNRVVHPAHPDFRAAQRRRGSSHLKLFAMALVCGCLGWFPAPASAGYLGYRLFTIDHTKTGTADSTNFTVLISGTWTEFRTTAYNNGKVNNTVTCGAESISCPADLVFASDAFCKNLLSWEIQTYTANTGLLIAWVKVPTLSASVDTLIYACAGNVAVTTFQGGSTGAAYDSSTKVVYHFEASTADSSSGGNTLNPVGSPSVATGQIGQAASFSGSNYAEAAGFSWTGSSAVTVTFWNYVTSANVTDSWAFTIGNSASTDAHRCTASVPWNDASQHAFWDYGGLNLGSGRVQYPYTNYLGAWTLVTLVSTGSADTFQAIYLNGALVTSSANSASSTVTGDLIIGGYPSNTTYGPPDEHGNIDEFRVANVVRSASWITAEYNNQSSPSTFYSWTAWTLVNYITAPQGFLFE